MQQNGFEKRIALSLVVCCAMLMLAYPGAYVLTHGLDPAGWPVNVQGTPRDWFRALLHLELSRVARTYVNMFSNRSQALINGGRRDVMMAVAATAALVTLIMITGGNSARRHSSKRYGDARWASSAERGRMTEGLEIGLDPDTGRTLRVAAEGNIVAIAPPRSGKTSGLILTNLLFPEPGSYGGPAVVIDPKGECYLATKRRREQIGKFVRCLDPLNLVGGTDQWNPILHTDPNDILYLQSVARALLPAADSRSESSAYFRGRAVTIIVAALRISILNGQRDLMEAARLLSAPEDFVEALKGHQDKLSKSALAIATSDARTRDPIFSSAEQVFEWCLDERLQHIVTGNTFDISDLRTGEVDLFIVLPSGTRGEILSPYLRWILSDLFNSFKIKRAKSRLIVYADESFVIGRSDQILQGVGELPGRGISMYMVWHNIAQILQVYGRHGTDIILGTAEVVTIFNTPKALPDETEHWSKALGSFTAVRGSDHDTSRDSGGDDAVEQRLVPASELASLTQHHSISIVTSTRYTANPVLARKTFAHRDRRFTSLLDPVAPTGPVGTSKPRT